MSKFRIGFNPDNDLWDNKEFRDLIKSMQADEDTELYLITTEEISQATLVQSELDMDDEYFFRVDTNDDIVDELISNKVLIYLSGNRALNILVNHDNPISLEENNVTGTQAIDVNFTIKDDYKVQYKYLTYLKFWTDQINKYDKKGT